MINEWEAIYGASEKKFNEVDISAGLSDLLQLKDDEELRLIRDASKASTGVMTKFLADEISTIIDEERKVRHSALSENVEGKLDDDSFFKKVLKLGDSVDPTQLDWCYSPNIQSGGSFDLKPSALPDDKVLYGGVIVTFLGLRYKSYCSNIGRTYLIDPTKTQEQNYTFVVALQKKVMETITNGVKARDVYKAAQDFIKEKNPKLLPYFLKNVGWGIGIEFRDATLLLNEKNQHVLKEGTTLSVVVGFQDIPNADAQDSKSKVYSILLIDTVKVTGKQPEVYTDSPKNRGDVSYYFKEEEEAKPVKKEVKKPVKSAILKSKLRGENKSQDDDPEAKRKQNQRELHEKLQRNGLEKYSSESSTGSEGAKTTFKRYESYKHLSQLPKDMKDLRIRVDFKNQTILLPINGRLVPIHIAYYKNGSSNEEGEYAYLRLNFNSPGQGVSKKDDIPSEVADAQFVRSITIRSRDGEHIAGVFKKITDLKKEVLKREAEKKEMEDIAPQGKLIEAKNRRPIRLDTIFVRPAPEGKRVNGLFEIHQNGLRYQSPSKSENNIEILFSNIKHLFFQPCDHELIVIIHAHLKSPIMVGKKKTKDIQIYREATDLAYDETGNRRRRYRYGDEDELEQEQMERQRRIQLNKEFKQFAEAISDATNGAIDVEIPFRELGFNGVPFRSNVLCQPTTESLIQLIDPPFLVVTLSEIEVVHLERVQFGLRQFDMVAIYKDFSRPVTHINSIPMTQLDGVKDWLNSVDVPYYEGPVNLNWPTIMKTVQGEPHSFFKDGGWSFLTLDKEGSGDESQMSSDGESSFHASDEDPEDESDIYSEDDSDFSGDASEGSYDDDDDDEPGEDWDEMDSKAQRQDQKAARGRVDDARKRKR